MGGLCFKIVIGVFATFYWLFYFVVVLLNALYINTNIGINGGGFTFASVVQVIIELIWWFWIFYNTLAMRRLLKAVCAPSPLIIGRCELIIRSFLQGGAAYYQKYRIYRNLVYALLIIGLWVVISYIVYVVGAYTNLDKWWRNFWFFDFYGEIAFMVLILVLMSSWRPGRDPVKCAAHLCL